MRPGCGGPCMAGAISAAQKYTLLWAWQGGPRVAARRRMGGGPPSRPQDPPLTSTPYDLTHPLGITLGLLGGVIFLVATQGQKVYLNPERCTALIY